MTDISLETLGLSKERIEDRIVERIAELVAYGDDEIITGVEERARVRIDEAVAKLAEKTVLPQVSDLVERMVFQPTNSYGEPRGEPLTFREHLISLAEKWIEEKVNWEGEDKRKAGSFWQPNQTRIAHMIHSHLHNEIETSVKAALADANTKLANGIAETVKMKLKEAIQRTSIDVKTR